jgi:Leucine-rich repeat (LRR) protein
MTSLQQIDLRNTLFGGEVPGVIGTLPFLLRLDLSNENNTGTWNALGSGFGMSGSLQDLDMSGNNFTSAVFPEVTSILTLTELDLSFNSLSGVIPTTIGNLLSLTDLDLSANALSGAVPAEIQFLTGIQPFVFPEEGTLSLCPGNGGLTAGPIGDLTQLFVDARDELWVNTSCIA